MVKPGALMTLPEVSSSEDPRYSVGGTYAYGLPYPSEKSYVIWQGFGGEFSHNEPGSRYAVDFSLPLDSEIAAARGGVVIGVIQKNPDNPDENPGPASMANQILILHRDGTIGVYAHLTTNGAKVRFGQIVQRGHAVANACFLAAVNRVGFEADPSIALPASQDHPSGVGPNRESGIEFWGQSFVTGPDGSILELASKDQEEIVICPIDLNMIEETKKLYSFPYRDRRVDSYQDLLKLYSD